MFNITNKKFLTGARSNRSRDSDSGANHAKVNMEQVMEQVDERLDELRKLFNGRFAEVEMLDSLDERINVRFNDFSR